MTKSEKKAVMCNPNADTLWHDMVELYASPGQAILLLQAQEKAGLDITLFLMLCLCSHDRNEENILRHVCASSQDWQVHVLEPLRQARRAAKARDARLYENLKQSELAAERAALEDYCAHLTGPVTPQAYLNHLDRLDTELKAQLMHLASLASDKFGAR